MGFGAGVKGSVFGLGLHFVWSCCVHFRYTRVWTVARRELECPATAFSGSCRPRTGLISYRTSLGSFVSTTCAEDSEDLRRLIPQGLFCETSRLAKTPIKPQSNVLSCSPGRRSLRSRTFPTLPPAQAQLWRLSHLCVGHHHHHHHRHKIVIILAIQQQPYRQNLHPASYKGLN